ncbi:hypothetical protein T492DRAFT_529581 [Pavlovales sp. CCMP2436]|nr:hypothetical protein T492DRAFT_529581 [Pavlovales sp. CCMP2436]
MNDARLPAHSSTPNTIARSGSCQQIGAQFPECADGRRKFGAGKSSCNRGGGGAFSGRDFRRGAVCMGGGRQLGLGNMRNHSVPTMVDAAPLFKCGPVRAISCGAAHTAVITAEGELFMAGSDVYGQVSVGSL